MPISQLKQVGRFPVIAIAAAGVIRERETLRIRWFGSHAGQYGTQPASGSLGRVRWVRVVDHLVPPSGTRPECHNASVRWRTLTMLNGHRKEDHDEAHDSGIA